MYNRPRQRGGKHGDAGAHVRIGDADRHSGDRWDFLRRHELEAAFAAHADNETRNLFISKLFGRTADTRNPRCAWDHVAAKSGNTPGVDGLRCSDLNERETWELMRSIHKIILDDFYRPDRDRIHLIPKASGIGHRKLLIPTVVDRMVQRAIVQMVQPYLDPLFSESSFGYRPGRDRLDALALAEQQTCGANLCVWVTEDTKDAFDQVPLNRLLDVVRKHIPEPGLLRLIERVVQKGTRRGLRQGGPLSPLLLNVYLDWHLDRRWRKQNHQIPLIRVADDILLLCQTVKQAQQAYGELKALLQPAGMPLKGTPQMAICDLKSGQTTSWLGFKLATGADGLQAHLEERSWRSLGNKLAKCHLKPDAPLKAIRTIKGWVAQLGPCFPQLDIPMTYARLTSLAKTMAFDEIPCLREIEHHWRHAYAQWCKRRTYMVTPR